MPYRYPSKPYRRGRSHPFRGWITGILLIGLFCLTGWYGLQYLPSAFLSSHSTQPAKPVFIPGTLEKQFRTILSSYPNFQASIVLTDVGSQTTASVNGSEVFTAASTTKLITAIHFLHEVEEGQHTLDEQVGDYSALQQLQLLINQSDNDSWNLFLDELGEDNEEEFAHQLGLTSFDISSNNIDADDLALLLNNLAQGKLLTSDHTQLLLSWMQNTYEEDLIPPAVPDRLTVYHKAGTLDDNIHDAALIRDGSRWYVLVIMSNGNGDQDYSSREAMIHRLTSAAVKAI